MTWFPDLDTRTLITAGPQIRAIGWLASGKPFTQGEVSEEFLRRLDEFVGLADVSARSLSWGAFGGFHECEFCDRPAEPVTRNRPSLNGEIIGAREFGVPAGPLLYVAPELVTHYIRIHHYQPPAEFVTAVLASPLPGTPEYDALTAPFARRRRS